MATAVVVAAVTLADAAPAGAAEVKVLEQGSALGPRARPSSLATGPDGEISTVTWTGWGGATATGQGTNVIYGGPDPRNGTPVTVTLSRRRKCGPYRLYTRAALADSTGTYRLRVGCAVHAVTSPQSPRDIWSLAQRPRSMGLGDPHAGYWDLDRWRRWNSPSAKGRGKRNLPVTGVVHVRVRLTRIRFCAYTQRLVYTRQYSSLRSRHGVRRYRARIRAADCAL